MTTLPLPFRSIQARTILRCARETRLPVDGMRTFCGEEVVLDMSVGDALYWIREAGWMHTGVQVFCPAHLNPRQAEAA